MPNHRRNYLINKSFQKEFVVKFCSIVVVGSILFGLVLYVFSKNTLTTSFENSRLIVKSTADYLLPGLLFGIVIVAGLTAIGASMVVILMTHRVAGPVYRFEKFIREFAGGRVVPDLKIRKKDEFQSMAVSLNKMTDDIKKWLLEVGAISIKLDKMINALSEASDKDILLTEDVKKIVAELKKDKQNLIKLVSYFKVS